MDRLLPQSVSQSIPTRISYVHHDPSTMGRIVLQSAGGPTIRELDVEIVERKGLGHPDTLCDSIMEQVAQALARTYLAACGESN